MIPEETQQETARTPEKHRADLLRYREGVEELMRTGSKQSISNGMADHAAILFEVFFKNAKSQVRIFCKNLNSTVFNSAELLQAAKNAVNSGKKIRIIVQEKPEESSFLEYLRQERSSNPDIELLQAPELYRDKPFNFCTMDETAVRVETDRKDTKASASMNLPEVAKPWADYFDAMHVKATPLASA